MTCARVPVFSYMNLPVSVTRPTYSASAISGVGSTPSARMRSHTISAVHDASGTTWSIVAEARVVVVVVDVDDRQVGLVADEHRGAVDVAAVQEDDEAVGDVVGDRR